MGAVAGSTRSVVRFVVLVALVCAADDVLASSATAAPTGPEPGCTTVAQPPPGTTPTRRVTSANELRDVLCSDFKGRVMIPAGASFEMADPCGARDEFGRCAKKPMMFLPLHDGVQLIGERDAQGRRPLLFTDYRLEGYSLFRVEGNDVRIQGLHIRGPEGGIRDKNKLPYYVNGIEVCEDPGVDDPSACSSGPKRTRGRNVLISDNELHEWIGAAVEAGSTVSLDRGTDPASYSGPRMHPEDAGLVRIEGNYLHHNARDDGGYGVSVGGGAHATIWGNVFDFNRHAVTSDGRPFSGYVARFNYVLNGGFKHTKNYQQHFDVHGEGTPESRANGHYDGGRAGEKYEIAFNTIRGEQESGGFAGFFRQHRPAFELRGRPAIGAEFNSNVAVHDDSGEAVKLVNGEDKTLLPYRPSTFNFKASGNRYDTDYSKEIAAGDFDGDRRTDVLVANGTAWFFSRAGREPWEFLRPSNKRIEDLGFADIDNDGITDVLYRDGSGKIGYVKSGRSANVIPLNTSTPVALKDVRYGDFDGDRLTDMFFTSKGHWNVWSGRTRTWTQTQDSSKEISQLLFGSFDAVPGTDVVGINSTGWSFSSGATKPWVKLNGKLTKNFDDAVAGDFDGDGRTDIAVGDKKWSYSRDGRGPLVTLRSDKDLDPYPPLKQLLIGRFDGGIGDTVLTLNKERVLSVFVTGNRFVGWHKIAGGSPFVERTRQNMR